MQSPHTCCCHYHLSLHTGNSFSPMRLRPNCLFHTRFLSLADLLKHLQHLCTHVFYNLEPTISIYKFSSASACKAEIWQQELKNPFKYEAFYICTSYFLLMTEIDWRYQKYWLRLKYKECHQWTTLPLAYSGTSRCLCHTKALLKISPVHMGKTRAVSIIQYRQITYSLEKRYRKSLLPSSWKKPMKLMTKMALLHCDKARQNPWNREKNLQYEALQQWSHYSNMGSHIKVNITTNS